MESVARKCTTQLLATLRQLMRDSKYVKEPLQAYIVPWADAHNSEYLAECDQQRAFISGFTGSAGTAIVTENDARLWTDGRYYLQASQELDSNWTLMKESLPSTPSQGEWLSKTLPAGSRVGADPHVVMNNVWKPLQETLKSAGHFLVPVEENLVNAMWENRPARPNNSVRILSLAYTGKCTADKLHHIRQEMKDAGATTLVITALDEVAWFLNMRGSDVQHCPVFFAYIIITNEAVLLFCEKHLDEDTMKYLKKECEPVFAVYPYEDVKARLSELACTDRGGKVWLSSTAPYSLTSVVPERCLMTQVTPIALMKAIKNKTEAAGMKKAHIKDGVALCCFFSWLEKEIKSSKKHTELSAAAKLEEFRKEQQDYIGPSFETISSSGSHGAIVHYKPMPSTDAPILDSQLYLCDSGGQYLDGTTDVTRTVHFGTPSQYERECFTRVLKGQLSLGTAIFPEKIKGNCLDSFARRSLWNAGLDYQHGTGHGIGHFLNVHEGPMGISWRTYPDDPGLQAGMFLSNEPGYYEDGKFGIRLENIVQIIPANTPSGKFLTFETVTMCPIQKKMICMEMLSQEEISQVNEYHVMVREVLGPLLKDRPEVLEWVEKETQPIS